MPIRDMPYVRSTDACEDGDDGEPGAEPSD
jgi:hypothetical protein